MAAVQWVRRLRRLVYRLVRTGSGYCFRPARTTLSLQALEDRLAPAAAPAYRGGLSVATADLSGDGVPDLVGSAGPRVAAYDGTTGAPLASFAFPDPAFTGEVFLAAGDVTGDGFAELVVAAGAGGGPRVTVTDPRTGQVLANFFAYAPDFRGGLRVAVADLDGDGTAEIVTVPGEGGGPQVRVFDGAGRSLGRDAFAFAPDFRGGASVAAGDVTGDGAADLVVGAGPGGGPRVVVLDGRTGTQVESYFAYAADFLGGVWVAAADVDGNGTADVVTGAGPGGAPQVRVFAGHGTPFAGWLAYAPGFTGGVRVTAADLTGDGFADVVTGPGPGGGPHVTMWDGYNFAAAQSTYAVTDGGPAAFAFAAPTARRPLFDGRTLLVPPAGGTLLAADLLRRFTDRPGEVGLYRVDDAAGSVGGVTPGDQGYAAAALSAGRTVSLFAPGDGAGASRPLALAPGGRYAAYLIRAGSLAAWLAANPGNDADGGPLAVFPFPAANPGGRDLFRLGPRNRAAFEETPGGDADANDAVVGFRTAAEPSDLPPAAITPLPEAGDPQPPSPPLPTPNFSADLAGWAVAEWGGAGGGRGTVVVEGGTAVMREGDSFTVTLSRSFVVPAGGGVLDFAYPTFGFSTPSPGAFVNDAFEAALLDGTGRPLVPTVGAGRDAFFNVTETQGEARGAAAAADGTLVRLDLSGVPAGTAATLVLRLVNNDADASGTAAVGWVTFPSAVAADPPVKFFVADAGTGSVGRFGAEGLPAGTFALPAAGSPAGAASNAAGDRIWVVDAGTGRVHVYTPAGGLVGEWAADATDPQGVSVAGGDLWLVDRGTRTVRRYVGGMGRTDGPAAADATFALDPANARPSDLVTDGATVWVTDDAAAAVFVYDAAGTLLGRWGLDPDNAAPSGVTRNPAGGADLWVLDRVRKQVFQYAGGADARAGRLGAAGTFLLGAGTAVPEGIADPPSGPVLTARTAGPGRGVPTGSAVLISGTAGPGADGVAVVAVTVDGLPADALDAAGGYFARVDVLAGDHSHHVVATDALGRQAAVDLRLLGTTGMVDPSALQDVSPVLAAAYARTSFREADRTLYADVAVRNTGAYSVGGPLLVGVRNLSDPAVRLLNAAGTLPDGTPYVDAGSLFTGRLTPGAVTTPLTLALSNPGRGRFTYDLVFYGRLNQSPALTTAPAVEATPGRPYSYAAAAADPDGDPLSFTLMSGPAGMAVDSATGLLTWVPAAADVGTVVVELAVADGFGGRAEQRYTLTVAAAPPNRPPVFRTDPAVCAAVGTAYAYAAAAADPDGDTLTYTLMSGPAGMAIDFATGLVSWIPVAAQAGLQAVVMTAADGRGGTVAQAFSVCVGEAPGNHVPEIVSTPPLRAVPDAAYRYRVVAVDSDAADTLSFRLESGPAGAAIDPASGMLTWTPAVGQSGPQLVVVAAEDGRGGVAEQAFTVEVSAAAGAVGGVVWDDQDGDGQRGTAGRVTYDAVGQFSTDTNPTGPWTYGYRDLLAPPAALTVFDTLAAFPPDVNRWVGLVASDGNPSVGHTATGAVVNAGTPVYRPDELSLHPGPGGEYAVVRFTAPRAGVYSVAARFAAADVVFGGTDAHVLVDGVAVFDAPISQDVGAAYDAPALVLRAGETVDFTVGFGGNGFRFDTTGLAAAVTGPGGQEPGLPGRVVFLDANDDGRLDPGEPTAVTDQDGLYTLADVPAGPVHIALEPIPGAEQTYPPGGGYDLVLTPGEVRDGADFGVRSAPAAASNRDPVLAAGGSATAATGALYRVDAAATDPDGDALAFDLPLAPAGMTVHPTLGVLVWRPTADQGGPHDVVLRVRDGRGGVAVRAFRVTVVPADTAPAIVSDPPPGPLGVGLPYVYRVRAVDADFDPLEFRLQGAVAGMALDAATGLFTWTPTPDQIGTRVVTVVVNDGRGGAASQELRLVVEAAPLNHPPVVSSVPPGSAAPGRPYRYPVAAADPDGDPLVYTLVAGPAGMAVDATTGLVSWTPDAGQSGPESVELRVADGRGGEAVQRFVVAVTPLPADRPPTIAAVPPLAVVLGRTVRVRLAAADPDGDSVRWELAAGPRGAAVEADTGVLVWTPAADQLGPHDVVVRAVDPFGLAVTRALTVTVVCTDRPPVIRSVPPTTGAVGTAYAYFLAATDPDGDAVSYTLAAGPDGLAVDPATGLVTWTPAADQVGPQVVSVRAVSGAGGAATQTFTVVVATTLPNRPPVVTSNPPARAAVGVPFSYAVAARDPDGDAVTYRLIDPPPGAAVDPATGLLTWTPTEAGTVVISVSATDPAGAQGVQTFVVRVTANHAPVITSTPPAAAVAGAAYRYDLRATDPDGDPLTYRVDAGPAGLAVDAFGRVTWTPAGALSGLQTVTLAVVDDAGAAAAQSFTVTVGPDSTAPRVELLLSTTAVTAGGAVRIQVRATDDVGVTGLTLTAGGVPLTLDSAGAAVFSPAAAGPVEVTATAADAAGNVGRATRRLLVADPAADGPEVSLLRFDVRRSDGSVQSLDPAQGPAELSYLTDVVGTAADPAGLFDHYQLLVAPAAAVDPANLAPGGPAWRVIGGGRTEVVNGVLGTFDPTTLQNDTYYLAVAAYDAFGHGQFKAALVAVSGAAKPGQFRLTVTDLSVSLAGIPVTVTRVYDTLDAGTEGDFGYGWTLAAADPRVRESVPQSGDGFFATGAAFRVGTKVYLTGPDGKRVGFTFRPEPAAAFFGPGFTPAFVPDPGVTSTLVVDPVLLSQKADGTFTAYLFGFPYNPDQYRLTTADGLTYEYDQFAGLRTVTDRNGTTLTYRPDGVFSSTGAAVRFVRDGLGRITQVIDPDGQTIRYAYTAAGDLASVTDRTGLVTTHSYRAERPHYLDEVRDPLGNRAVKAEYDAAGRLLATTDALGHRSVRGYDPANFTETVADPLGNVTKLVYDERGNVIRETDPLGHITLRAYDAAYNETATTDPLGRTTRRTFDARRNLLSETDPLGHTTRYEYDRFNNVTRVTDPLGRVTVYLFDERGNPAGSIDALGNATRRTNDARGRPLTETDARGYTTAYEYAAPVAGPTKVTHPDGTSRTIAYDAIGLPVLITDERGERLALAYDAAGRLLAVTAPDGGVTRYGYTGDRLTRQTDPLGRVTLYGYDAADRLTTKTDARGGITRYGYDAADRLISTTDPRGNTTTTTYDAAGRVDRVTDALGGVTRYGYDAAGNRTSETDANGNRRNYVFDELNRLVRKDDCPCPDETYTYDAVGTLLTVTDKRGNVTRYAYDALDRLLTETDALGGVTRYGYDASGNVTATTDANGHTTTSAYDGRDRLIRQTDPAGFSVSFAYDGAGNQTATTDQLGHTTRFGHDGLGRLLTTTDADGGVTANAYDLAGNLVATTDPLGHTTRYTYDELNRQLTTTDAEGGVVQSEYDAAGNRTTLTDQVGNRTTFGYDALNRQTRETDPLGHSILTGYDAVGNRTALTDRNGRLRTFVYDELDRLTDETWWDGTAVVRTVRSTYDSVGNLTGITDPDGTLTFTYDALNRQITADNAGTPNAPRVVLTSRYDAVGNRIEVRDDRGVTVGSAYDARDLLAASTWQGGGVSAARLDFSYDAGGRRTEIARSADLAGTAVVSRSTLGYDALGRVMGIAHGGAGGAAVSAYGYAYDAASRLARELRDGVAIDYSYDLIDELVGADRATGPDESYAFDAAGNRTGGGYQTGAGNRLVSDGTFTYGYDFEGNLVRKTETATGAVTEYAYDHRNRLVAVTTRDAGGAVVSEVRYAYDALDRRTATTTNGIRTVRIHDSDATWADYDAAGAATARYLTGDVIDEMLARFRSGEGTAWYLTDKLGTVRELLGPTGAVVTRLDYDSFGRLLSLTNPGAGDRFTYTGREFDAATGLYYYRARFYDPAVGRFNSEDPIRFTGGDANLHRYVMNRPMIHTDPMGMIIGYATAIRSIAITGLSVLLNTEVLATASIATAGFIISTQVRGVNGLATGLRIAFGLNAAGLSILLNEQGKEHTENVDSHQSIITQYNVDYKPCEGPGKPINSRGRSRGRHTPNTLAEQIALQVAMSNPWVGLPIPLSLGDPRWPAIEGWEKMAQNINGVEIHYVANRRTCQVDDFKFS